MRAGRRTFARLDAARASGSLVTTLPESAFEDLSARARRILVALITEYVDTGEPVGSRVLSKKYGLDLSAASIRNVLADLEDAGLLAQPHTSAGRVPTDRAFRYFIDALLQLRPLATGDRQALRARFADVKKGDDLLRSSGKILSDLTGGVAVVLAPRPETRTLRQLRFIPTRPGELLSVIVFSDGHVENAYLPFEGAVTEADLARVHELLADVIDGRTLSAVRDLCERRLADEQVRLDSLRHRAFELGKRAAGAPGKAEVLIEGQSRLLERPELADVERLRELVLALDDRRLLVTLLDRTVEAEQLRVVVGHELGELGRGALGAVAAPYSDGGRVAGAIAVLDVMRMDYSKVMPVVTATASEMTAAIDRARRDGDEG